MVLWQPVVNPRCLSFHLRARKQHLQWIMFPSPSNKAIVIFADGRKYDRAKQIYAVLNIETLRARKLSDGHRLDFLEVTRASPIKDRRPTGSELSNISPDDSLETF